jgi:uncharacterized repeat protein (TIGR01451 family)
MAQRKLLIIAFALTLGIGGLFFATAPQVNAQAFNQNNCATPNYNKNHKNQCAKVTPTPTPTPTPSAAPSPTPSGSISPTASPTVSPAASPTPTYTAEGAAVKLIQGRWKTATKSVAAVVIGDDAKAWTAKHRSAGDSNEPSLVEKASRLTPTGAIIGLFSGSNSDDRSKACFSTNVKDNTYEWTKYIVKNNISLSGGPGTLYGNKGADIDKSYIISSVYTGQNGALTQWKDLGLIVQYPKKDSIKVYYRISDVAGTDDPADKDWIQVTDPAVVPSPCHENNRKRATYKIDRQAKYFQYKIHMKAGATQEKFLNEESTKQNVERVEIVAQPLKAVITTPSPVATVSAAPTADPAKGLLTIQTKKITSKTNPSPTPSSGAPLPNFSPTPTPVTSASPIATGNVNPVCFAEHDTDPAPAVRLNVKQTSGGTASMEDQITDDEGRWYGLDGEIDQFAAGTYAVTFKEYQNTDLKLVGICVTPDDGEHYIKTQTSATGGKATVIVRAGTETKVTALYAARNKPFVSMDKFAVSTKNKVIKSIVPGQSFRYLIRYENTGGVDAKNVVIQDVIPEQFYVPASDQQFVDKNGPFTTSLDARGRTIITKKMDSLAPGQKGSITIPVTLRSDAFGSPSDIAAMQNQANQSSETTQTTNTTTPSAQASANSGGSLQLQ